MPREFAYRLSAAHSRSNRYWSSNMPRNASLTRLHPRVSTPRSRCRYSGGQRHHGSPRNRSSKTRNRPYGQSQPRLAHVRQSAQRIPVDERRGAGLCRLQAIRRSVRIDGPERQRLPNREAGGREKIDESVGVRAERPVGAAARQRGRVEQYARPAPGQNVDHRCDVE